MFKKQLDDILSFTNGDTAVDTITHWCTGCCNSQEESLSRLIQLVVPWLARGYPVPLLSRFKHYAGAASYVKAGCSLCRLLPRTLELMKRSGSDLDADLSSMIDALLHDSNIGSSSSTSKNLSEEDMQALVGGLLDADMSYALQNSLRKSMMTKAFCAEKFPKQAVIIDCILQPSEIAVNALFARTHILHELTYAGSSHPRFAEMVQKSRAKFLQIVKGDLGKTLMKRYLTILHKDLADSVEHGLDIRESNEELELAFQMVIVGISDSWRRLVHEFESTPWSLFRLVGLTTLEFVEEWKLLHSKFDKCEHCVDQVFTGFLLMRFPMADFEGKLLADQEVLSRKIQHILMDVASWAPMSSDLVEIKHGAVQWAVSRRGAQHVKSPGTAREFTLLQSCIKQFQWIREIVQDATMPRKQTMAGILKMVGTKSTNQYSSHETRLN